MHDAKARTMNSSEALSARFIGLRGDALSRRTSSSSATRSSARHLLDWWKSGGGSRGRVARTDPLKLRSFGASFIRLRANLAVLAIGGDASDENCVEKETEIITC